MILRQTSLSKNIVEFCRYLRQNKFSVSIDEEISALLTLAFIDYNSREEFSLILKSVLCKSYSELQIFNELFNGYWKEIEKAVDSKIRNKEGKTKPKDSFRSLKSWLANGDHKDKEEKEELARIIQALSKRLAATAAKRYEKSNRINLPDISKTLRLNMRTGGELIRIYSKKPKKTRTNVVMLCDVSKSMDLYTHFFLQFMYAFQQVYHRIETFTFGTSLHQISHAFRHHDFSSAFRNLNNHNDTWSGGTRIGECLSNFISDFGKGLLGKKTIIIILSDGWDTGEIALLQNAMQYLKKHSKTIIWLNPLAGFASYRPDTAGMNAAMPYIDIFSSAHNADSLKNLFLSSVNRLYSSS